MVFVPNKLSPDSESAVRDVESWLASLPEVFAADDIEVIRRASHFVEPLYAGRTELTGVSIFQHVLGVASILIEIGMSAEVVVATILHAVPEVMDDWQQKLGDLFGDKVLQLVASIHHMERIRTSIELPGGMAPQERKKGDGEEQQQVEGLRKMLLAMVEDIRVVLIYLADRTEIMRNLSHVDARRQQVIAQETRNIFAPLANRLGVWQIKWELEDLSLRYLEPKLYKEIAHLLDEKRVDREQYIAEVLQLLEQELARAGIKAQVTGRPKHIYSIVNKMRRKQVAFNELYDVRAVRILVDEVKDCYAVLGLIHNIWQPIPKEFDDYIARPKSNNYRSLHTVVIGPRNLALEIQIRTHEMHRHSELGVAAHWRYKEGAKADSKLDDKILWLRQILEWQQDVSDSGAVAAEQLKSDPVHDKIYVLTPQGRVISLPNGATPVDFAYALHTTLGHRTRGAKVDGSIVPLNYKLQNGQRVEIMAAKQGAPSRDWLNPGLGYLQSTRARAKVRHWFRYQNFEEDISQGRVRLEKELHKLGATAVGQEKIAQKLRFAKLDDFLAAMGRGDISERQLAQAVCDELPPKTEVTAEPLPVQKAASSSGAAAGVLVEGVGNLVTNMAKCCKPVPPDLIVGYVTRGRGVTIHRQSCTFVQHLPPERQDRLLSTRWGNWNNAAMAVDIDVEAHDRQGLLRDISDLFSREKVNMLQAAAASRRFQARMHFSVEVIDLDQLTRLLTLVRAIPGVIDAQRHV